MTRAHLYLAVFSLSLVIGGCSANSVTRDTLDSFASKAQAFENEGDLRQALEAWKIALTANPGDTTAKQRKEKLEARIAQSVAEQMALAVRALERKSILEARRHFLTVLALDPSHAAAFDALRTKIREIRTLSHSVRPGDTFSSISELYYGDRSRADVLWETNELSPNARLAIGTTLLIPEIPGLPFNDPRAVRSPVPSPTPATASKSETTASDPNYNPLLSNARDALGSGDFDTALASVDRFLISNPRHTDALEVKKSALYEQGKAFFSQKKYPESLRVFEQLARLAPNFLDSNKFSSTARNQIVQENYSEGVRLFREEKLTEAIARWRAVLEFAPNHANARKNIDQAERMLQNLKSQQQKVGK